MKWRTKVEDEIGVSSINFDFTVSFWNINYEYHPQYIFKGHKDVVNGFVLSPNEDFIITASKDSYLIWQSISHAICPFNSCNKAALGFNIDDVLVFRSEHKNNGSKDAAFEKTLQNKLSENFTPSILIRKERQLMLFDGVFLFFIF